MQAPVWTDFLQCSICTSKYNCTTAVPVSLSCTHSMCKKCISRLQTKQCPYDKLTISFNLDKFPPNTAFLLLLGYQPEAWAHEMTNVCPTVIPDSELEGYTGCREAIERLALFLKPLTDQGLILATVSIPRPILKKLATLLSNQILDRESRTKAVRAAQSIAERIVTELLILHQNQHQISSALWTAVRNRGCQFMGPVMQEEALKLILKILENDRFLSRKTIVLYVVQKLLPDFPNASKTNIGHIVQLLYRASCFNVEKRVGDSSLMQLKEEYCTYEALRREHDAQIIKIAMEAGLRISPETWSTLLYGTTNKKSDMQSIIDKLVSLGVGSSGISELIIAIGRSQDEHNLNERLLTHLDVLLQLDVPSEKGDVDTVVTCSWELCTTAFRELLIALQVFTEFAQVKSGRYKTGMCPYLSKPGGCPRGVTCPYAHSEDERKKYVTMVKPKPRPKLSQPSSTQLRGSNTAMSRRTELGTGSLPLNRYSGEMGSLSDSSYSSFEHSSSFPGSGGSILHPPDVPHESAYFVRPGGSTISHAGFYQEEIPPTPPGYNPSQRFPGYDEEVVYNSMMYQQQPLGKPHQEQLRHPGPAHHMTMDYPSYHSNEFEHRPSGNHSNELTVDMATNSSTDSTPVTTSNFYPPSAQDIDGFISNTLAVDAWKYNNAKGDTDSLNSSYSEGEEEVVDKPHHPVTMVTGGNPTETKMVPRGGVVNGGVVSEGGSTSGAVQLSSEDTVEELRARIKALEMKLEDKSDTNPREQFSHHPPPPPPPPHHHVPYYNSPQNTGYIDTMSGGGGHPQNTGYIDTMSGGGGHPMHFAPQQQYMQVAHNPPCYDPFTGLPNQVWCPPMGVPPHSTHPNSGLIVHHMIPPQHIPHHQPHHLPQHHGQKPVAMDQSSQLQTQLDENIAHFVTFQEQSKAQMGMKYQIAPGSQLPTHHHPIHHPPIHHYGFPHMMAAKPY